MDEVKANLGPLGALIGKWEGQRGLDIAPEYDGVEKNAFREVMTLEPMVDPVENGQGKQVLYGLRYHTTVWRIKTGLPFHEEQGYWLWDGGNKMVMKSFIVPRGIAVNAGGFCEPNAKSFKMSADVNSPVFGVCSNPYLDKAFKTVRYELDVELIDEDTFSYFENTVLQIEGRDDIFHHTDKNTLKRIDDA